MLPLLSALGRFVGVAALGAVLGSSAVPAAPVAPSVRSQTAAPSGAIGRDVGDVSCAVPLSTDVAFGVIGTTAGKPYYPSGCLSSEYSWASELSYRPQYYVNLADPGHKSAHWDKGGPRSCHSAPKYDAGCAYDYGYEAAQTAWGYARAIGASGQGRWWLDVETDNTWGYTRNGIAANVAVIRGALDALRAHPHVGAGVYTETVWWEIITGDSRAFSGTAVWGGGAGSKRHARENCRAHSITGGPALLAQWITGGVDHDITC
jgi:hypothetical protein